MTFSSNVTINSEFTRDYSKIVDSLDAIQVGDFSNVESALNAASDLIIDEWACFTNVHVLLITDQTDNLNEYSVQSLCKKLKENRVMLKEYYFSIGVDYDEKIHTNSLLNEDILDSVYYKNLPSNRTAYFQCKYPFSFPNRFDIICLNDSVSPASSNKSSESQMRAAYEFDESEFRVKFNSTIEELKPKEIYLKELIKLNSSIGELYITRELNSFYITNEFCNSILNELFNPFNVKLKLGSMYSMITLIPAPIPFKG
jgi:hypothetical protein